MKIRKILFLTNQYLKKASFEDSLEDDFNDIIDYLENTDIADIPKNLLFKIINEYKEDVYVLGLIAAGSNSTLVLEKIYNISKNLKKSYPIKLRLYRNINTPSYIKDELEDFIDFSEHEFDILDDHEPTTTIKDFV